ncbi:MAG: PTS sugar transporter subunit IIB [Kyrpidia sp.]|nr:PTS sugar transporter subunit IIB [Kyrpidia sp.]
MKKKVLVICGTGVATSTVIVQKLKDLFQREKMNVEIVQGKVMEVSSLSQGVDLVVSTTKIPVSLSVDVVNAVPLLTGVGQDEVFSHILSRLKV